MDESLKLPELPGPVVWGYALALPVMLMVDPNPAAAGLYFWVLMGILCVASWYLIMSWVLRRAAAIRNIKVGE